jgi:esterase
MPTVKLNYKTLGEQGFPIVILHGLFGMLDNWQTFAKNLAESGYKVYILDQRDHGKSPFTNEFNYEILANDLQAFLDEHHLYKIHLIGHSMGGKVAMQFAFNQPFYLEKLVIVDICNKTYKGGHEIIFQAINDIDTSRVDNRNEIYDHLHKYNLDEGTIQFLLKNLQRKPEGGYDWKMNNKLLEASYDSILSDVGNENAETEINTLFVKGGESNYIKPSDEEHIKNQFPYYQIVSIANAGHWVHADKPIALFNEVKSFLES